MLDTHQTITGVHPLILGMPSYSLFVALGICAGLAYYLLNTKKERMEFLPALTLVAAALISALIGSKIPLLFLKPGIMTLLTGKSIVGALLGGMAGVVIAKKIMKIKVRLGNIIAPSVALGMAIGRFGCFFGGCCYGKPSSWGFDFGDGLLRLPTQLFEAFFHACAFIVMVRLKGRVKTPGILFKIYVLVYFTFRFFMEFIRETPVLWMGMTIYQIICALGVLYITALIVKIKKDKRDIDQNTAGGQ